MADIALGEYPWRHYIVDNAIKDLDIKVDRLLSLHHDFQTKPDDPYSIKFCLLREPSILNEILSKSFLTFISEILSRRITLNLENYIQLRVHYPGDPGFPRHPDNYDDLRSSFIAILYVNRDWQPADGGILCLHESQYSNEINQIEIHPIFNRMVIFETTNFHWHSVTQIENCPRYSIIFEFFCI